ncbi:MAG: hypothetical protein M1821_008373 [Bathelium mastoideum]|nr:MAG: hypothetical protein M1821_008373 [Bathelium mastoideum]
MANPTASALKRPDGLILKYHLVGQGPLCLCIMGSSGLAYLFRHIVPFFAKHFTLCLYDRRGFSTPNEPAKPEHRTFATPADCIRANADDAAALLQHISPDEPAHILSTCFGSTIALDLLTRHPHTVVAALIHEPSLVAALDEPARSEWSAGINGALATYDTHGRAAALDAFLAVFMAPVAADLERARLLNDSPRAEIRDNSLYAFQTEMPAMRDYPLEWDALEREKDKMMLCCGRDTVECRPHKVALALGAALDMSVRGVCGGHSAFADPRSAGIWSAEVLRVMEEHDAFPNVGGAVGNIGGGNVDKIANAKVDKNAEKIIDTKVENNVGNEISV